jgi:DNA-binding NarL/FixJ family response regulator
MENTKVLVVEDDDFTRASLVAAISGVSTKVVAAANSSASALREFESMQPDVMLIDLDLGSGPTGIDLAVACRRKKSELGIVFLTSYSDPRLLRANLPNLPDGSKYLVKSQVSDIAIVVGEIQASMDSARKALGTSKKMSPSLDWLELTDIQIETLRLVAEGYTNSEIAKMRSITERGVEQAISKIAKALAIESATSQNQRVHIARTYFRLSGKAI